MRIGIVTTWFERGAAYVSRAYMETLQSWHEVFIYARGGEKYAIGDPQWDLPNVTWAPKPKANEWHLHVDWKPFRQWLANHAIELVIFNEQHDWRIILDCAKRLTIPFGAYVDYYTTDTWKFFWLYDFLICNTKRHYGLFHEHPQCLHIPWGTQPDIFSPREELVSPGVVTFFHSAGYGKGGWRKGTDLALKAFAKVKGDCRLVLHSQAPQDHYNSLAAELADPRVTFIKETVPLPGLYHLGDVYVYPSRLDGIGLSLPEALAAGLPVITTNAPPMNEFVKGRPVGMLVAVDSYRRRGDGYYWPESYCEFDALVAAMQWIADNPNDIPAMKKAAREHACQHLDWHQNSQTLAAWMCEMRHLSKQPSLLWQVALYERWRQRFKQPGRLRVAAARLSRAGDYMRYLWPW